jgi:hypothetical protein
MCWKPTRHPANGRAEHSGEQRTNGTYNNLVGRWLGHVPPLPTVGELCTGRVISLQALPCAWHERPPVRQALQP